MKISTTKPTKTEVPQSQPIPDPTPATNEPDLAYHYDQWWKDKEMSDKADDLIYHIRQRNEEVNHSDLSDSDVVKIAGDIVKSKLSFLKET